MEQTGTERRVRIIPAAKKESVKNQPRDGKQRVAAYCRVSTDSEEQLNSYKTQKNYYTQKIEENPDWEMAGVFADATCIIGTNQNPARGWRFVPVFFVFRNFGGGKVS
jgi:hypothetical protein